MTREFVQKLTDYFEGSNSVLDSSRYREKYKSLAQPSLKVGRLENQFGSSLPK